MGLERRSASQCPRIHVSLNADGPICLDLQLNTLEISGKSDVLYNAKAFRTILDSLYTLLAFSRSYHI